MYIAIALRTDNDTNGNPRKVLMIYEVDSENNSYLVETLMFSYGSYSQVLNQSKYNAVLLSDTIFITKNHYSELKKSIK